MQTTLTAKSQITLPRTLQHWLGVKQGDKLEFSMEAGDVKVRKVPSASFDSLLGVLPKPAKAHTVDEMNEAIGQALGQKHATTKTVAKTTGLVKTRLVRP